jgi:hypothetical protein
MSVGKIRMLDGLVSAHCFFALLRTILMNLRKNRRQLRKNGFIESARR